MMIFRLEAFLLLLGYQLVTSDQICPHSLSSECQCTVKSNKVYVTCRYEDSLNITQVLVAQEGQLQPSWVIEYFGIPSNNLTYLPSDYFDGFDVIYRVNISGNLFTSIPDALKQLSKSVEIDFSSNMLQSLNITELTRFRNLRKFDISENNIMEVISSEVSIPTLREINLSSNNIASIESKSFLSFPNLRNLIMSGNRKLQAISAVDFPGHISALRLESNGIKTVEFTELCKLMLLNDLESLNLDNNDLDCSCGLFTLFMWVERNRDDGLVHEAHGDDPKWDCIENDMAVNISEFGARMCNATTYIFNTDLCIKQIQNLNPNISLFNASNIDLEIDSAESEYISLEWSPPNTTVLYGFVVIASYVDSEDEPFYKSAVLHPDTLSHSVQGSDVKSGNFRVCVQVLIYNETTIGTEDCKSVYIFSKQIVVGILAGVVFIVPFTAILFCIIRLDRRHIRNEKYLYIQNEVEKKPGKVSNDKQEQTSSPGTSSPLNFTTSGVQPDKTQEGHVKAKAGTENQSFEDGDKIEVKIVESSADKNSMQVTPGSQYGAISSHL